MSLSRLTKVDRQTALAVVKKSCPTECLEEALSMEHVYLGFQGELIGLPPERRHCRAAELIVTLLGDQLLKSPLLREALCKTHGIEYPKTWQPGTEAAARVCVQLGLPATFSGNQAAHTPAVAQRLPQRTELPNLLDYQCEARDACNAALTDNKTALLSIPTGSGKTRVATEVLRDRHESAKSPITSLWLAHTDELCEQAVACIGQVWAARPGGLPTVLLRAWGRHVRRLTNGEVFQEGESADVDAPLHSVVVSTPQTARNILSTVRSGTLGHALRRLSLLIVDEAHRAATPMYADILAQTSKLKPAPTLLGLSATPVRETYSSRPYDGTLELARMFTSLIEPTHSLSTESSPIIALQARGVLATLTVHRIGYDGIPFENLIQLMSRNLVTNRDNGPALLFTSNASDAKVAAVRLTELGHRAEFVTGETTSVERMNLINALRRGHLNVLCNCEILTTGFDAPNVSEIYLARTTQSPVLYKQIIGRGLRGPTMGGASICNLYLCGVSIPFDYDPNTAAFARAVWSTLPDK